VTSKSIVCLYQADLSYNFSDQDSPSRLQKNIVKNTDDDDREQHQRRRTI
jgi:hypothetical protein